MHPTSTPDTAATAARAERLSALIAREALATLAATGETIAADDRYGLAYAVVVVPPVRRVRWAVEVRLTGLRSGEVLAAAHDLDHGEAIEVAVSALRALGGAQ